MTAQQSLDARVHTAPVRAPEGPVGRSTGWWGMVLFISTEGATFASAIAAYFYLRFAKAAPWPPPSDKVPDLVVPSIATAILVLSAVPMFLAARLALRRADRLAGLLAFVTFLAGAAFVTLQVVDWVSEWPSSTLSKDAYGSLFFSVTGLHTAHVVIGLGMLLFVVAEAALGRLSRGQAASLVALYWYFMAVLAVAVYVTVYLTPYL